MLGEARGEKHSGAPRQRRVPLRYPAVRHCHQNSRWFVFLPSYPCLKTSFLSAAPHAVCYCCRAIYSSCCQPTYRSSSVAVIAAFWRQASMSAEVAGAAFATLLSESAAAQARAIIALPLPRAIHLSRLGVSKRWPGNHWLSERRRRRLPRLAMARFFLQRACVRLRHDSRVEDISPPTFSSGEPGRFRHAMPQEVIA
jgi:hypothetical protein